MSKMTRVYVAGALNSDAVGYIKNMHRMIQVDIDIRECGFAPFNPCLDFLVGLVDGELEYDDYAKTNMEWLEVADCVYLVPGWEYSKGTKAEIERAGELGIPVFYSFADLLHFDGERRRGAENRNRTSKEKPLMIEYEFARDILEELWRAFSGLIDIVGHERPDLVDDNEYYKKLRERLFDFGVRGIADMEYNDREED